MTKRRRSTARFWMQGTNWYEAAGSLAFYIEDTDEIRLQVVPIHGGKKEIVIGLDGLKRPYRSCLLELAFSMQDKETLELTVLDHGFGSFFAPVREPFTKATRLQNCQMLMRRKMHVMSA